MHAQLAFPPCRVCNAGDMVPLSDHSGDGAAVLFKAWACTNEACGFTIRIRKDEVFRLHLHAPPPPEPEPSPPDGRTWQVWQRHE